MSNKKYEITVESKNDDSEKKLSQITIAHREYYKKKGLRPTIIYLRPEIYFKAKTIATFKREKIKDIVDRALVEYVEKNKDILIKALRGEL